MTALEIYRRTIALLAPERGLASALAIAGVALAVVQLAEPSLFGRMVDALAQGHGALRLIGLWAAFGLFGILAGALVASSKRAPSATSAPPAASSPASSARAVCPNRKTPGAARGSVCAEHRARPTLAARPPPLA
jgi:hypothetical protein